MGHVAGRKYQYVSWPKFPKAAVFEQSQLAPLKITERYVHTAYFVSPVPMAMGSNTYVNYKPSKRIGWRFFMQGKHLAVRFHLRELLRQVMFELKQGGVSKFPVTAGVETYIFPYKLKQIIQKICQGCVFLTIFANVFGLVGNTLGVVNLCCTLLCRVVRMHFRVGSIAL